MPCARQSLFTQIHQENIKLMLLSPGKPNVSIARAVCLAQAHRPWDLALAFPCPSLVRLQSHAAKICFWSGNKCVLQSCLNIAQGNRNAGQGCEHSKNNTGLAARSSASSPFSAAASQGCWAGRASQGCPRAKSMLGAQPGRDIMYHSPQTSSAVQGLGTPLPLEIQKSMLKGALLGSSSLCTPSQQEWCCH